MSKDKNLVPTGKEASKIESFKRKISRIRLRETRMPYTGSPPCTGGKIINDDAMLIFIMISGLCNEHFIFDQCFCCIVKLID